jgi:Pyruvate/2-oxoacid:ferredoxin oxidoreductase delta subunit
LRVAEVDWSTGKLVLKPGTERDIECDLIVSAIGQGVDFTGLEFANSGKGTAAADSFYRSPKRPGVFVGGDAIKPHLLTTAIGHGWKASESIDRYVRKEELPNLPKVNVHPVDLLAKLTEAGLKPTEYNHVQAGGTDRASYAIHNYEDRSRSQIVPSDELFLAHFQNTARRIRSQKAIDAGNVLGNFDTRLQTLTEAEARAEADRCMSCGMCFECNNCIIYCPQAAVHKVKKKDATMGRYVETDYAKCVGCHICKDVCPTGYIQMGLER